MLQTRETEKEMAKCAKVAAALKKAKGSEYTRQMIQTHKTSIAGLPPIDEKRQVVPADHDDAQEEAGPVKAVGMPYSPLPNEDYLRRVEEERVWRRSTASRLVLRQWERQLIATTGFDVAALVSLFRRLRQSVMQELSLTSFPRFLAAADTAVDLAQRSIASEPEEV